MNGQIYSIDIDQMDQLLRQVNLIEEHHELMMKVGRQALHLYAGIFDHKLLCLLGVVPETIFSSSAYIWCYHTKEAVDHRVAFGRHAIKFVRDLMSRYDSIYGHCLNDASRRWLRTLGATMTSPSTFEIKHD